MNYTYNTKACFMGFLNIFGNQNSEESTSQNVNIPSIN